MDTLMLGRRGEGEARGGGTRGGAWVGKNGGGDVVGRLIWMRRCGKIGERE